MHLSSQCGSCEISASLKVQTRDAVFISALLCVYFSVQKKKYLLEVQSFLQKEKAHS